MEDEFRETANVGIVIQCYLRDSGDDLVALRDWAQARGTPVWVRLVKGAYWDYETVTRQSIGWPVPVFQQKWQSDANFERQTRFVMRNEQLLRPALGSHNLRSLAHGIAVAEHLGLPKTALRAANALRHGRRREAGAGRAGPPAADLHALRRADSRHGVPRAAAAGEHVERFVPAGELRGTMSRRRSC